ncbi:Ger(x)C family spore germination protein [Paenibacillus timonensis]|nr:Ger(x)C family spore germination protein [Paenibacillus timonensis]
MLTLLLTAGCWDSSEVNDLALELAWGIDSAKDKGVMISAQVIAPFRIGSAQKSSGGGGGGQDKPYFVVTGIGKDTLDAVQQMQNKLSRQVYRAHRRVIVIGEAQARKGLKEVLDTYSRDPNLKLRSDVFIVRGGTAKEFLNVAYPLEDIPGMGALKEYSQIGALKEMGLINLMISSISDGNCPALPAIAIGFDTPGQESAQQGGGSGEKGFRIAGTGIFDNDLKLLGFIDANEGKVLRWIKGELGKLIVTSQIAGENGKISMDLNKLNSKVQPIFEGDNIKIQVTLIGQGMIRENNTGFDLTQPHNLNLVQEALEKQVETNAYQTITKVQDKFGTDVFEFGEVIHRMYPSRWRSLKDNWNQEFRKAEISVKAKLTIRKIGVTGPSLHLKEREIKK